MDKVIGDMAGVVTTHSWAHGVLARCLLPRLGLPSRVRVSSLPNPLHRSIINHGSTAHPALLGFQLFPRILCPSHGNA